MLSQYETGGTLKSPQSHGEICKRLFKELVGFYHRVANAAKVDRRTGWPVVMSMKKNAKQWVDRIQSSKRRHRRALCEQQKAGKDTVLTVKGEFIVSVCTQQQPINWWCMNRIFFLIFEDFCKAPESKSLFCFFPSYFLLCVRLSSLHLSVGVTTWFPGKYLAQCSSHRLIANLLFYTQSPKVELRNLSLEYQPVNYPVCSPCALCASGPPLPLPPQLLCMATILLWACQPVIQSHLWQPACIMHHFVPKSVNKFLRRHLFWVCFSVQLRAPCDKCSWHL